MSLTTMLAVSWVISEQYHSQSKALLGKTSKIIEANLNERKKLLLDASRQLATQRNLGSTIWYLGQYSQANINPDMLFVTYQQLANDTHKIGHVANLSKIAIYDMAGHLVSFSNFDKDHEVTGFVEGGSIPRFKLAYLHKGEELSRTNIEVINSDPGVNFEFGAPLPNREIADYAVVDTMLAIKSYVPIMGETFDPLSRKQQIKQLGLVVMVQELDQSFIDQMTNLSEVKINLFTPQGLSRGSLPDYRTPDWQGVAQSNSLSPASNEIKIDHDKFYQYLIPLYTEKQLIGTIAVLNSKETVQKNIWEMIGILALITILCLLMVLPLAWFLAKSISQPISALSAIFRGIADSKEITHSELGVLKNSNSDELNDLTQSFMGMHNVVKQKIQQIQEINTSLEETIKKRTQELQLANEELTQLSMRDALTQLPNRRMLNHRLVLALAQSKRTNKYGAIMFIDLDNFKPLNDQYGHDVGDLLLIEVARRLTNSMREMDTVARFGGDEFVVMLNDLEDDKAEATAHATIVAEKILATLSERYEINSPSGDDVQKITHRCSASIGVAMFINHEAGSEELLKWADMAMYQAKESGRNQIRFYEALKNGKNAQETTTM
jgi:diguanylate cyclase (GGDEF)-like protein